MSLVLALLAPLVTGGAIVRAMGADARREALGFIGWAYVAGSLAVATVTGAWLLLGKPIDGRWLAPLLLAAGAIGCGLARRRPVIVAATTVTQHSFAERALFGLAVAGLALLTVDRIAVSDSFAIVVADEATIWAAKAKLLFCAGAFDDDLAAEARYFVMQPAYPLLNPLLQLGIFAGAGEVTHVANRLPIQMFALVLLAVSASAVRRLLRPALAAVLLLLLFTHEETRRQTATANADIMIGVGLVVLLDAWLRLQRTREPRWGALAAVAAAFLLWSKNEGALLLVAFGAALLLVWGTGAVRGVGWRWRDAGWWLLPAAVVAVQLGFNAALGFRDVFLDPAFSGDTFTGRLLAQAPESAGTLLAYVWKHVLAAPSARLLLLGMLVLAVIFPRRLLRSPAAVPLGCVTAAFLGYQIVFLATPHGVPFQLDTGATRITFQLVPAAVLALAVSLAELFPGATANRTAAPVRDSGRHRR